MPEASVGLASVGRDGQVLVRSLPVEVGQRLQATVVEAQAGNILLGWRGGVFAARSAQTLQVGQTYEFQVTKARPAVLLEATLQLGSRAARDLVGTLNGEQLVGLLEGLVRGSARAAGSQRAPSVIDFAGRGVPTATELEAFVRSLGLDQEARVLQLPQQPATALPGLIRALRQSVKASALQILQQPEPAADWSPSVRGAARQLVEGLNQVERDNARRADHGAPLWLPLPAAPQHGLLDARMFLAWQQGGQEGPATALDGARPFSIVLLLDLLQLGPIRVDVGVTDRRVDVQIQACRPATVETLLQGREELQAALAGGGLEPGSVRVSRTPEDTLPVSDLVLPPVDGTSLVDLHA